MALYEFERLRTEIAKQKSIAQKYWDANSHGGFQNAADDGKPIWYNAFKPQQQYQQYPNGYGGFQFLNLDALQIKPPTLPPEIIAQGGCPPPQE